MSYIDLTGNKVFSSAGKAAEETNILLTVISPDGFIEKQIPVTSSKAFFGTKAIKLNSNSINILGYQSPYINKNYEILKEKKLQYILVNSNAEVLYSTWHD